MADIEFDRVAYCSAGARDSGLSTGATRAAGYFVFGAGYAGALLWVLGAGTRIGVQAPGFGCEEERENGPTQFHQGGRRAGRWFGPRQITSCAADSTNAPDARPGAKPEFRRPADVRGFHAENRAGAGGTRPEQEHQHRRV